MLTEKQIIEIREHLEKAQNPVFFFDNDVDGLCSFLLLRRAVGRGRGVVIKSSPDLNSSYIGKIDEFNQDYVFVLDKHLIAKDFLEELAKRNIPVVWIDHHDVDVSWINDGVYYYNPIKSGSNEPTTYLCYKVAGRKEDDWLALLGCISDGFIPDFFEEVRDKNEDLLKKCRTAFECVYDSEFGRMIRLLSFGLKDRTTNVVKMLKFLIEARFPRDILEENDKTYSFHSRFKYIEKKYKNLIEKAEDNAGKKLLYFQYGGELSISAEIANELAYKHPDKIVVVAYISGARANISIRGRDVRKLTLKAIEGLEGATGGGHKDATGAKVLVEDLPKFKEKIEELAGEKV